MRSFFSFLRTIFVSIEFAVMLAGFFAIYFGVEHVRAGLVHLKLDGETIRWFALGPIGIMVFIFRESRALVLPTNHRTDLHDWAQYEQLRICGHVARGYAIVFTCLGVAMWIYRAEPAVQLIILATALIGAASDYYSVYLAEIRVNELLSRRDHVDQR